MASTCRSLLILIALLGFALPAMGQTYQPGPSPTCGPINYQVVDDITTLPTDRKEWGMGEMVNLWINRATWYDTDYLVSGYGGITSVTDDMGDVYWSVTGPGSVYPTVGDTTQLTVGPTNQDASITVTAAVHDSGSKGLDPVLFQAVGGMDRKPDSVVCIACADQPDPTWKAAPPAGSFGARGFFTFQVKPNTVLFRNYSMKFISADYTFKWNNPGMSYTEPKFDTDYKLDLYHNKKSQWNLFDYVRGWGTLSVVNFNGKDLPDPASGSDYYKRTVDVSWKYSGIMESSGNLKQGVTLYYQAEHAAKRAVIGFGPSSSTPPNSVLTGPMGPWQ